MAAAVRNLSKITGKRTTTILREVLINPQSRYRQIFNSYI